MLELGYLELIFPLKMRTQLAETELPRATDMLMMMIIIIIIIY